MLCSSYSVYLYLYTASRSGAAQSSCGQRLISAMADSQLQQSAPSSVGSDDWDLVAADECEKAEALNQQIQDADDACSASEAEMSSDAEGEGNAGLNAAERVRRFQEQLRQCEAGPKDDPYWIKSFLEIVEHLEPEHCAHNWAKPLSLVSGCSGMLAEGWACKARFLFCGVCHTTTEKHIIHLAAIWQVVTSRSRMNHSIIRSLYYRSL